MPRYLLLCGLVILGLPVAAAQAGDVSDKWGLGIEAGMMKLVGGNNDLSNVHPNFSFHLRRGLSPRWTLDLSWKYGWVRPGALAGERAGASTAAKEDFYTVISQPELGLLFRQSPQRKVCPFIGLSLGITSWSVRDLRDGGSVGLSPDGPVLEAENASGQLESLQQRNLTGAITLGLETFPANSVSLSLGLRYHRLLGVDRDNIGIGLLVLEDYGARYADENNGLAEGFLGLTFFFGSSDQDGDRIKDKVDACPHSAEDFDGFEDTDGCPDRDNDGDGILDNVED